LSGLLGDSAFFDDASFTCFLVCERLLVPGCPDCRKTSVYDAKIRIAQVEWVQQKNRRKVVEKSEVDSIRWETCKPVVVQVEGDGKERSSQKKKGRNLWE